MLEVLVRQWIARKAHQRVGQQLALIRLDATARSKQQQARDRQQFD